MMPTHGVDPFPRPAVEGRRLDARLVADMMDMLPSVYFSIKDTQLRFVHANAAMATMCGVDDERDVIGRRIGDFFHEREAQEQEDIDRHVLQTHIPVRAELCLTAHAGAGPIWALHNSWPVFDQAGALTGVSTLLRGLDSSERFPTYRRLKIALDYIDAHFAEPLEIGEIAERIGVSISQLERDFRDLLEMPPRRYIIKVRLEAAAEMLRGDASIADIAHACGFSDQSAFTRRFRAATGRSPSKFRRLNAAR